jgi:Fic family protein
MRRRPIHELSDWPRFHWDPEAIVELLAEVRHRQGRLSGRGEALGSGLQQEALLEALTSDAVASSATEGQILEAEQVRSSLARRLGRGVGASKPADQQVEGVVEMLLDASRRYDEPLSEERLFRWHDALFPLPRGGADALAVSRWREDSAGPMQIVSGPFGSKRVHFEALPEARVGTRMAAFIGWFNRPPDLDEVLRAAVAHLWFVTIHPFDDGNGRVARVIADMALARSVNSPLRFYSMSAQIEQERSDYDEILERIQAPAAAVTDVTAWMEWFLDCLGRAIDAAQATLGAVLAKARLWESLEGAGLNQRQTLVVGRLRDGPEGKLTTSGYAELAKCSQDTALRDILQLVERAILVRGPGGGRSTNYVLAPPFSV